MSLPLRGFNPPRLKAVADPLRLHLGCGRTFLKGWVNVDAVALPGVDRVVNLDECRTKAMPFADDSVDEMFMSHVIEHINDTLSLMQELHRISKDGSILTIRCPYGSSDDAWEDQTHVRPYFIQSFGYFSMPFYWRSDPGYRGDWQPEIMQLMVDAKEHEGKTPDQILARVLHERNIVKEMIVTMKSIKPIREAKKELQVLPKITFVLA